MDSLNMGLLSLNSETLSDFSKITQHFHCTERGLECRAERTSAASHSWELRTLTWWCLPWTQKSPAA